MNLTDKQVGGLTLRMLAATAKMPDAKACAVAALQEMAQRDREWVDFIKEKYGIDYDFAPLRSQYEAAINTVNGF